MVMDLSERIKQIFVSWIRAYPLSNKTDVEVCLLLPKIQKEVLAELTNYKLIPKVKWQEIVEHIKIFPRNGTHLIKNKWKDDLEAKVAELDVEK